MPTKTYIVDLTNKLNKNISFIKEYLSMVVKNNIELKLIGVTPEFATNLLEDTEVDEICGDGEMTYVAHGYFEDTKLRIFGEGWDGIAYFTKEEIDE